MDAKKVTKPQKKKLQTMVISLILAIVVWFMVMSLTNPTITVTLSNLKVRFIGEVTLREKQLAITGRDEIPALSVTVRGNRSDLMNYMDDIYVQIDLSNIDSEGTYSLTGKVSIPTTRITVERVNFGEITVNAEEIISKDIEIKLNQTGVPAEMLVDSRAREDHVTVSGAKSEIDEVAGAVAAIDMSDLREGPRRVSYLLVNSSGSLITSNETIESPKSEIEVENTVYHAKSLPVEPVLSDELGKLYNIDKEKTAVAPSSVTVGVKDYNHDESVKAVITQAPKSGQEQECTLASSDGMYIPKDRLTVTVNPELDSKDPANPNSEVN